MSGVFAAAKFDSHRIDLAMPCEARLLDSSQTKCFKPAFNAVESGRDYIGRSCLFYYCDEHDKERL